MLVLYKEANNSKISRRNFIIKLIREIAEEVNSEVNSQVLPSTPRTPTTPRAPINPALVENAKKRSLIQNGDIDTPKKLSAKPKFVIITELLVVIIYVICLFVFLY